MDPGMMSESETPSGVATPQSDKESRVEAGSTHSLPAVPAKDQTFLSRSWEYMTADVKPSAIAEFELILLTICTGIQDAVSFPDFHCFASNQTGNTVFLMLAATIPEFNGEMFITANISVALAFFLAAGWLTGQLGHIVGRRCRLWLIFCNFIQTCLVFTAGALQYLHGTELNSGRTLVVIGVLAFAAGSQVVQARSLAMTEISTAMATAAWVDLMIDPNLFALRNRPRTRRVAFLISLFVGSLFGALIYKRLGSAPAIIVSAAGKFLVTVMYFFNNTEKKKPQAELV